MVQKRNTNQKTKILGYLKSTKSHPTAEQVFLEVKKSLPSLSLATVYRNLNQMAEDGKILKLEINNEFHFDALISTHQHVVCNKCGKIEDIFRDEISKFAINKLNAHSFTPSTVDIMFKGVCVECKTS